MVLQWKWPQNGGPGTPKKPIVILFSKGPPPFGRGSDPNFLNGGTINLHFGWFGIIFNKNNVCYNRNDQNFGRNTCFLKKWMVFDWKKPKMSHKKKFFSNLNVFWVEFYSKLIQIMKKLTNMTLWEVKIVVMTKILSVTQQICMCWHQNLDQNRKF